MNPRYVLRNWMAQSAIQKAERNDFSEVRNFFCSLRPGFVRGLKNLESPGILLWHFPELESPGKDLLNMKCMADSKEN